MAEQYSLPSKKRHAPRSEDPRGMTDYIRQTAKKYGIDPEVALRVAKSEGLSSFQSGVTRKDGTQEPSYGAFQLYTGGGLGNQFQKDTGLDPSDPKNEKATIEYALKHAASNGWGSWYGAKNSGIGDYEGIGTASKTDAASGYGGIGSDAAASARAADFKPVDTSTSTADAASEVAPSKETDYKQGAADVMASFADLAAKGPVAQNAARASGPTTIAAPSPPTPPGVAPIVDPRMADMQRQQLAMALQRLNSRRLV